MWNVVQLFMGDHCTEVCVESVGNVLSVVKIWPLGVLSGPTYSVVFLLIDVRVEAFRLILHKLATFISLLRVACFTAFSLAFSTGFVNVVHFLASLAL